MKLTGTVHPHIALAVWVVTVTDHLGRCFICLGDGKTQEFLFHPLYKRCEIAVSTLDDPVRHGLSGNVYAIPLEFLLYTVECRRIHILHIQNGSKQGRGHNAVAQQVFRAVLGLNDLIEQEQFDTSVYPESLLTPLRYEGELYALPQEVSPFVIYYNKEMFEAANVPLPTDDWTIDEFYAAAEALTDPAEKVYGYRHPGAWADQVLGWLSRAGVDFDISGKEVKGLDTPEALNALTFLYDLVVKDELSPNPAALTAMGKGADAMFRNQKVAMESAGLWMLPTYKENPLPFEWDVVRMPMDKNQNTKAGILNWGISKSTKNPEAAWDLLKFLCGPEGNRIVAESNMALPGSTDKEALQIVLDSKFPSNVKAFVDSVPDCDLKDQLSSYRTEVNTKVQQLVDEMLIGKSTPEETQEKLIKEINAILAN